MKIITVILLVLAAEIVQSNVVWSEVPSIRSGTSLFYSGQITTVVSLTTSADVLSSTTDHTATFKTPLSEDNNLKYGLSLMSY